MGTKAERRAARERVAAYHEACLDELVAHVATAVDRWRPGEIDVHEVDETIHQYHRAAQRLWSFCFTGSGSHTEMIANTLDRMDADGEAIDWWEHGASRRRDSRAT